MLMVAAQFVAAVCGHLCSAACLTNGTVNAPPLLDLDDALPICAGTKIKLFALDSCRYQSRHMGSNAFGYLGGTQIEQLETKLKNAHGPVVVVLHHHLVGYRGFIEGFATSVRDAHALLRVLASYCETVVGNDVLVVHGHQHMRYMKRARIGEGGKLSVYCGPSSTMGVAVGKNLDGIARYARIWYTKEAGFGVQEICVSDSAGQWTDLLAG